MHLRLILNIDFVRCKNKFRCEKLRVIIVVATEINLHQFFMVFLLCCIIVTHSKEIKACWFSNKKNYIART